ncbi:hypothetical protein [Akkermansia sp.]|uniref:hypothetical protein n=1 Tax=Akkermansia sp. TaxID=1872421 RepID=UPI003AACD5C4
MFTVRRIIITITFLTASVALLYLIGGRNALIYFPTALLIAIYYYGKKWWNEKCQQSIEKKVKQQLTQTPLRTTFPTIPGMKNPLQEDLEREKEQKRLKFLENIKGSSLYDLIMREDDPKRDQMKKITRESVMPTEKQIREVSKNDNSGPCS